MIVVSNRTKSPRPYELPISVCAAVSERVGLQQGFDDNLSPDVERANREGDAAFARSFGGFAAGSAINMRDRQLIELAPRLVGVWDTNADEVLLSAGLGLARSDYALRSIIATQTNVQNVFGDHLQSVRPVAAHRSVTVGARDRFSM